MKSKKKLYIIITCEHADYKIPEFIHSSLPEWFDRNLQKSHQSYDKGALQVAKEMQKNFLKEGFETALISYPYSRLLIDANRTPSNKGFYSQLCPYVSEMELKKTQQLYDKYRISCEKLIQKNLKTKNIFIFSVHSFVPVFKNKTRSTDIGILFRNTMAKEKSLAVEFKKNLKSISPQNSNDLNKKIYKKSKNKLKTLSFDKSLYATFFDDYNIHLNRPYRGHTDCFLNSVLDPYKKNNSINGLFFEFNQSFLERSLKPKTKYFSEKLMQTLVSSF